MRTQAAVHDLRLVDICVDTHGVHDELGLLVDLLCVEWTSLPFMISVMSTEGGRDVVVVIVIVIVVIVVVVVVVAVVATTAWWLEGKRERRCSMETAFLSWRRIRENKWINLTQPNHMLSGFCYVTRFFVTHTSK